MAEPQNSSGVQTAIRLNTADNVAVCIRAMSAGEDTGLVVLRNDVPRGHKVALVQILRRV